MNNLQTYLLKQLTSVRIAPKKEDVWQKDLPILRSGMILGLGD